MAKATETIKVETKTGEIAKAVAGKSPAMVELKALEEAYRTAAHALQNATAQRDAAVAEVEGLRAEVATLKKTLADDAKAAEAKRATDVADTLAKAKIEHDGKFAVATAQWALTLADETAAWESAARKVLGVVDTLRTTVTSMGGTANAAAVAKEKRRQEALATKAKAEKALAELGDT